MSRRSIGSTKGSQVICEEIFDEDSVATHDEVLEYAKRIGIDPEREPHLLHIANEGVNQSLPAGWKPCFEEEQGLLYYFNFRSGETRWEHPLDASYRERVAQARRQLGDLAGDSGGAEFGRSRILRAEEERERKNVSFAPSVRQIEFDLDEEEDDGDVADDDEEEDFQPAIGRQSDQQGVSWLREKLEEPGRLGADRLVMLRMTSQDRDDSLEMAQELTEDSQMSLHASEGSESPRREMERRKEEEVRAALSERRREEQRRAVEQQSRATGAAPVVAVSAAESRSSAAGRLRPLAPLGGGPRPGGPRPALAPLPGIRAPAAAPRPPPTLTPLNKLAPRPAPTVAPLTTLAASAPPPAQGKGLKQQTSQRQTVKRPSPAPSPAAKTLLVTSPSAISKTVTSPSPAQRTAASRSVKPTPVTPSTPKPRDTVSPLEAPKTASPSENRRSPATVQTQSGSGTARAAPAEAAPPSPTQTPPPVSPALASVRDIPYQGGRVAAERPLSFTEKLLARKAAGAGSPQAGEQTGSPGRAMNGLTGGGENLPAGDVQAVVPGGTKRWTTGDAACSPEDNLTHDQQGKTSRPSVGSPARCKPVEAAADDRVSGYQRRPAAVRGSVTRTAGVDHSSDGGGESSGRDQIPFIDEVSSEHSHERGGSAGSQSGHADAPESGRGDSSEVPLESADRRPTGDSAAVDVQLDRVTVDRTDRTSAEKRNTAADLSGERGSYMSADASHSEADNVGDENCARRPDAISPVQRAENLHFSSPNRDGQKETNKIMSCGQKTEDILTHDTSVRNETQNVVSINAFPSKGQPATSEGKEQFTHRINSEAKEEPYVGPATQSAGNVSKTGSDQPSVRPTTSRCREPAPPQGVSSPTRAAGTLNNASPKQDVTSSKNPVAATTRDAALGEIGGCTRDQGSTLYGGADDESGASESSVAPAPAPETNGGQVLSISLQRGPSPSSSETSEDTGAARLRRLRQAAGRPASGGSGPSSSEEEESESESEQNDNELRVTETGEVSLHRGGGGGNDTVNQSVNLSALRLSGSESERSVAGFGGGQVAAVVKSGVSEGLELRHSRTLSSHTKPCVSEQASQHSYESGSERSDGSKCRENVSHDASFDLNSKQAGSPLNIGGIRHHIKMTEKSKDVSILDNSEIVDNRKCEERSMAVAERDDSCSLSSRRGNASETALNTRNVHFAEGSTNKSKSKAFGSNKCASCTSHPCDCSDRVSPRLPVNGCASQSCGSVCTCSEQNSEVTKQCKFDNERHGAKQTQAAARLAWTQTLYSPGRDTKAVQAHVAVNTSSVSVSPVEFTARSDNAVILKPPTVSHEDAGVQVALDGASVESSRRQQRAPRTSTPRDRSPAPRDSAAAVCRHCGRGEDTVPITRRRIIPAGHDASVGRGSSPSSDNSEARSSDLDAEAAASSRGRALGGSRSCPQCALARKSDTSGQRHHLLSPSASHPVLRSSSGPAVCRSHRRGVPPRRAADAGDRSGRREGAGSAARLAMRQMRQRMQSLGMWDDGDGPATESDGSGPDVRGVLDRARRFLHSQYRVPAARRAPRDSPADSDDMSTDDEERSATERDIQLRAVVKHYHQLRQERAHASEPQLSAARPRGPAYRPSRTDQLHASLAAIHTHPPAPGASRRRPPSVQTHSPAHRPRQPQPEPIPPPERRLPPPEPRQPPPEPRLPPPEPRRRRPERSVLERTQELKEWLKKATVAWKIGSLDV